MANTPSKLTGVNLHELPPKDKPYKRGDADGLYLYVQPNGRRLWRIKYRFKGREKLLSLGAYPQVSLKKARAATVFTKQLLANKTDPAQERQLIKEIAGAGTKTKSAPAKRTGTKRRSGAGHRYRDPLMTDSGYVVPFVELFTARKRQELEGILPHAPGQDREVFFAVIRDGLNNYRAHLKAHGNLADAREQNRYFTLLERALDQFNTQGSELSHMLDSAPTELRQEAAYAGVELECLQEKITLVTMAINDVVPSKSKYRPEVEHLVRKVAQAYQDYLLIAPEARAYKSDADIPQTPRLEDTFAPFLAKLLDLSVDHAYRLAKRVLSS